MDKNTFSGFMRHYELIAFNFSNSMNGLDPLNDLYCQFHKKVAIKMFIPAGANHVIEKSDVIMIRGMIQNYPELSH